MSSIQAVLPWMLAVVLGCCSGDGRADSSASVKFSRLAVELFDLNRADGIEPGIALSEVERSGFLFQYPFPDPSGPALREDQLEGNGSATLSDSNGSASITLQDASMDGAAVVIGGGAYTALLTDRFTFTLTPYTRVVFSSLAESALSAVTAQSALAVVTLGGQLTSMAPFVSFESSNVRLDPGSSAVPISVETSSGDFAVAGDIALHGYAYAGGVMPIPEPGAWAMLLAGLAVLAATRGRRLRAPGRLKRSALTAALAAVAAASGIAQASSGSASIHDFTFELIDLDETDGITPSLMFTSDIVNGAVFANMNTVLGNPWDETRSLTHYGADSIDKPQGAALVELSPGSARAAAHAGRGAFSAAGSSGYAFTLTPHTHVRFSAIAQLDVAHYNPTSPPDLGEAEAGLLGEIFSFPGQRTQFDSFLVSSTPGSSSRTLAVHAYSGDVLATGYIRADARAFAIGVSPIPEPAPWAMLLAGLSLSALSGQWGAIRACSRRPGQARLFLRALRHHR